MRWKFFWSKAEVSKPPLTIKPDPVRTADDQPATILCLNGKITSSSISLLKRKMEEIGTGNLVVLDMSSVIHVDRAGMDKIERIFSDFRRNNGAVKMFGLQPDVMEAFLYADLCGMLKPCRDQREALCALAASRPALQQRVSGMTKTA